MSISLAPVALTARQLVNELTPRVLPWAVFPLGLRPAIARNHGSCTFRLIISLSGLRPAIARNYGCCNIRYFLCSLGVLCDTTEFHAFSRHIRVSSCYSVATIKIFVRCIVTGCEVATRIFFNNERSERSEIPVLRFLLPTSLRGSWRTTDNRRGKMLTKIKR